MLTLQYIIIAVGTIAAIYFLYKKFSASFNKDCSTGGCGCAGKTKKKKFI